MEPKISGDGIHVIPVASGPFTRPSDLRSALDTALVKATNEYIADQLGHHRMADSRVQSRLEQYQKSYPRVALGQERFSSHGVFWYNLHVVLVNDRRWMEIRDDVLRRLGEMIERVAAKREHLLSRSGMLADHVHLALGCGVDESPQEIALCYLNNCAYACGMKEIFMFSYYAGTFGEYDLGAV